MSRTYRGKNKRRKNGRDHRVRIRSDRRAQPDLKKLSSALLNLAQAQAEADAEAGHRQPKHRRTGGAE